MLGGIEEALREIAAGRIVIVTDDEDRENEGDFVMAAEKATPADVNFMALHGRGLICVSAPGERIDALVSSVGGLPLGLSLTDADVTPTGVTLHASGTDVALQ